ncbi:hypothetical protein FDECE_1858 [Fusarium decemcellulare]|nr:hypothetical protein FDECE_1858 [Fusarium decemcellulare]
MTGKPIYSPEEIRLVLGLMIQDLFNEEISDAFNKKFGRSLTDNQIRYLRNKYGRDPDYGPAKKKQKRRRATTEAFPEDLQPAKRRRQEETAVESPKPPAAATVPLPETQSKTQPSSLQNSPNLLPPALPPAPQVQSPDSNQSPIVSPTVAPYTLSASPRAQDSGYVPGTTQISLQQSQHARSTLAATGSMPINSQFGQRWIEPRTQKAPDVGTVITSPTAATLSQHPYQLQPGYGTYPNAYAAYQQQLSTLTSTINNIQDGTGVQTGA